MPGYSLGEAQKKSLQETMPSTSKEDLISINNKIVDIRKRVWVWQNRKKVAVPDEDISDLGNRGGSRARGGRGKGRGVHLNADTEK